jgi:hypothetical protein
MKSKSLFVSCVLSALALCALPAHADCTPGETRCGADTDVQRCNSDHTWDTDAGTRCDPNVPNRPAVERFGRYGGSIDQGRDGNVCTKGFTRCGADGEVERCTEDGTWDAEPGSSCDQ